MPVCVGVSSPEELTTERAHTSLEHVFETLRSVGRAREHLKQLRSVYSAGDGAHQVSAPAVCTQSIY